MRIISFCSVTKLSKKEQFIFPPGPQARGLTVSYALPPHSLPRCHPFVSSQDVVVGRCVASPRISGQSLQGRREFCCDQSERDAFWPIYLNSTPLHHRKYVDCPCGATRTGFVGVANIESGPSQPPIQDVDAEAHLQMHPAPGLVCSGRPEGRLRSCLDSSSMRAISTVCVRGSGRAVQGPPLQALPVHSCLCESHGGRSCPITESRPQDPQLSQAWSAHELRNHRELVLWHLSQLGLRLSWEKSILPPVQRNSFLRIELDSVSVVAHLTKECVQSMLNCLSSFRGRMVVPLKHFQRLLGHMASAVSPLGLHHMGPLQYRLHSQVPRWAWHCGIVHMTITPAHCRSFSPWTDLVFLRVGVP